jgi:hypothetical protein
MNQREESNKNHKDNHHQMMINKFNPKWEISEETRSED